jgi:integrase
MALTAKQIENAKPAEKTFYLFDERGMYLEITPKGSKRWRLKYYLHKKEKRISLGIYPDVSLKEAREKRDEIRKQASNGIDPVLHKKAITDASKANAENTFAYVAKEWLLKQKAERSENHHKKVSRLFERDLFPYLGNEPIADLTSSQILSVLRRIESRVVETAHRALGHCSQVFRDAVATGRAASDPTRDLKGALKAYKKNHFAAVVEPKRLGQILRLLHNYEGMFTVQCALKLMPLVFVRPGELRQAQWCDIDLENAEWRFLVTKTDTQHIVPLSRQALEIINELKTITGQGRYLFRSARSIERPMSDNAILSAMRSLGIPKDEMSGHGFRAVARTLLDEVLGFRADFIEHQLAHAVRDPHGRAYNRTKHLEERRKMMQAWADYLDGLRECKVPVPELEEVK